MCSLFLTLDAPSQSPLHFCVPNAYICYNTDTDTLDFHMLRDVKKDTEITVSYFQDIYALTQRQRNDRLRKWGFSCTCSACISLPPTSCTLPPDVRREKIKSLFSEVDQFTIARLENSYDPRPDPRGGANISNQEVHVILDNLKEIIRLMKEEGLYGLAMSQLLEDHAPLHDETGNPEARRSQMAEALRIRQRCLGNFHPSTLELQRKIDRLH
ncbi:lysine methyltransferase [Apiospora aurea]|uniref:Lysine methyltransferase n=1 Tax=Apiospora aurea TaxID=335848 RepID=A0ABR1PTD9_9PEZI